MFNYLIVFAIIFIGLILSGMLYVYFKYYRTFRTSIKKALDRKGLTLISISTPELSESSPFPRVKSRKSYVYHESQIFGINGEEVYRRIVVYKNSSGVEHKVWVQINTRLFMIDEILWSKPFDQ